MCNPNKGEILRDQLYPGSKQNPVNPVIEIGEFLKVEVSLWSKIKRPEKTPKYSVSITRVPWTLINFLGVKRKVIFKRETNENGPIPRFLHQGKNIHEIR